MRRGLGFLGLLVTIVIVAVVGVIAYQAGWSDGFAQHLPAAGTAAAPAGYPYYYGGPHFFGFGWIFGLLFFLFFIWLLLPHRGIRDVGTPVGIRRRLEAPRRWRHAADVRRADARLAPAGAQRPVGFGDSLVSRIFPASPASSAHDCVVERRN